MAGLIQGQGGYIGRMMREAVESMRALGKDDDFIAELIGIPVQVIWIMDRHWQVARP